ncbi:MAG: DNA-binding protein [Bdellovibrionales bacterium]|jgi:hypothetical protein|nr:DNA-binding protein [Bdellovibrionales bacterium]MBT3527241.1 DNA-binding protein [Bdellovibrionales bacterium]MBT7670617.1 DNA-binding protein [Bdellovibrionales bacterium]MBT7767690.1 DNA-binding protein [Bdellovibrionales bacterium]
MKAIILTIILSMTIFQMASGFGPGGARKAGKVKADPTKLHQGKVIQTMNSGGYTYVQVKGKKDTHWAATKKIKIAVGDQVEFIRGTPMKDFKSKTLKRTFKTIYFTKFMRIQGDRRKRASEIKLGSFQKAQYLVGEIFAQKDKLKGKTIKVRGKVVKFNPGIMKKNWIHIQDGSGTKKSFDLTVTTNSTAKVGDQVLITAKVTTNKDFGSGYFYPLILEDAKVEVE